MFQFPERHFIGRTMSAELTVAWPLSPEHFMQRQVGGGRRPITGFAAPRAQGLHIPTGRAACELPQLSAAPPVPQALATRTHQVLAAVGLEALPLDVPLAHLSDGYKR